MTPHEHQLLSVICPAIQSENLIRIWYKNATSGLQDWRTVEPYLVGSNPRKHIQLSAWVLPTPEQTLAGQREGWRAYILKNISEVQVLSERMTVQRRDYDPLASGLKEILCSAKKQVLPIMRIA